MDFTVVDADGNSSTFSVSNTDGMESLVDSINAASGGKVKASLNDDGQLVLSNDEGAQISVAYGGAADATTTGVAAGRSEERRVGKEREQRGSTELDE